MVVRSWRKAALILYLIINLKSLPFAWHIRVLYHFITNIYRTPCPPKPLSRDAPPSAAALTASASTPRRREILAHPLFTPVQINTITPLLETDYNFHKSNSTYLSDMDVSRTKLVTRLFSPGFPRLRAELDSQGYRGRMVVALGSAHVTFRKEIGIYAKVAVRSRVLSWDAKWLITVTYFVQSKHRQGKKEEELCAIGLSKYVVKKGRFTVRPDRVLTMAGWIPENPADKNEEVSRLENGTTIEPSPSPLPPSDPAAVADDGQDGLASAPLPDFAQEIVMDEQTAANTTTTTTGQTSSSAWNVNDWTWREIEDERLRGLRLAQGWLGLDTELQAEFEAN